MRLDQFLVPMQCTEISGCEQPWYAATQLPPPPLTPHPCIKCFLCFHTTGCEAYSFTTDGNGTLNVRTHLGACCNTRRGVSHKQVCTIRVDSELYIYISFLEGYNNRPTLGSGSEKRLCLERRREIMSSDASETKMQNWKSKTHTRGVNLIFRGDFESICAYHQLLAMFGGGAFYFLPEGNKTVLLFLPYTSTLIIIPSSQTDWTGSAETPSQRKLMLIIKSNTAGTHWVYQLVQRSSDK